MFTEVVPQVAALAEDSHASSILTAEVLLRTFSIIAIDLNDVMPLFRNTLEVLD